MLKARKQLLSILNGYISNKINYAIFFVTSKCNSKCKTCFYWKNISDSQNKKELTVQEYQLISSKWKNLFHISLTGGEPLLRPDLKEIIDVFYKNSSTRSFGITTNGLLPDACEKLIKSVLTDYADINIKLSVSIDAIGEKHDDIRGVKGNFKSIEKTIEKIKKISENYKNLDLRINLTYSSLNQSEIINIIDYLKKKFNLPISVGLTRGNTRSPEAKDITAEGYFKTIECLKKKCGKKRKAVDYFKLLDKVLLQVYDIVYHTIKEESKIINCVAGKNMVVITEEGKVLPCEMLTEIFPNKKFAFPNLRDCEYDIKKALKSPDFKAILKHIKDKDCHCTFECAIMNSIIYNPAQLLKTLLKK